MAAVAGVKPVESTDPAGTYKEVLSLQQMHQSLQAQKTTLLAIPVSQRTEKQNQVRQVHAR